MVIHPISFLLFLFCKGVLSFLASSTTNLNLTGSVNWVRTATPRCFPGFHLGMLMMTLIASLSKYSSTPWAIFGLEILPSFSIMNRTDTIPEHHSLWILPDTLRAGLCNACTRLCHREMKASLLQSETLALQQTVFLLTLQ